MKSEINTKGLEDLQKKLEKIGSNNNGLDDFFEWASKQIAARFLSRVIKRTPVEENTTYKYRMAGGRIGTKQIRGGALRRGWTGGKDVAQEAYLKELGVIKYGRVYQLTISNNVEYAPFVEFGHKQRVGQFVPYIGKEVDGVRQGATLKKGAVKGEHMMEMSANEIKVMAPGLAEKLVLEYLQKNF